VARLGAGDFFGEIALIGDPHRTATVVAASDVELAVLTRREFRTLLARFPAFASTVLSTASRRVVASLREVEAR
jgi:CRP-like cAMP-binding protein